MSYRCGICRKQSQPGMPESRRVVKRPDGTIVKEIRICDDCERSGRPEGRQEPSVGLMPRWSRLYNKARSV